MLFLRKLLRYVLAPLKKTKTKKGVHARTGNIRREWKSANPQNKKIKIKTAFFGAKRMVEKSLLQDKPIREFLEGFSEQKWPVVLKLTTRHGIHALRERFDLSRLSVEDLARLVRLDDMREIEAVLSRDHPEVCRPPPESVTAPPQQPPQQSSALHQASLSSSQQEPRPTSPGALPSAAWRAGTSGTPAKRTSGVGSQLGRSVDERDADPYRIYPEWWWHPTNLPQPRDDSDRGAHPAPAPAPPPSHGSTAVGVAPPQPETQRTGAMRMAFTPPRSRASSLSGSRHCEACESRTKRTPATPAKQFHHRKPTPWPRAARGGLPYDVSKVKSVLRQEVEKMREAHRRRVAAMRAEEEEAEEEEARRESRQETSDDESLNLEEEDEGEGSHDTLPYEPEEGSDGADEGADETPEVVRDSEVRGVRWRSPVPPAEMGKPASHGKRTFRTPVPAAEPRTGGRPSRPPVQSTPTSTSGILFPRFSTPTVDGVKQRSSPEKRETARKTPAPSVSWGQAPPAAAAATVVHHHTHIHYNEPAGHPSERTPLEHPSSEQRQRSAASTTAEDTTLEDLGRGLQGGLDQLRQSAQEVLRKLQQAELERARLQDELVAMS